jgi:hypothetical protein
MALGMHLYRYLLRDVATRRLEVQIMSLGNTTEGTPHEKTMEQGLWRAVIAGTIAEWFSGPLSRRREAEAYLFDDTADFQTVCESAGMDATHLRSRLKKLRTAKIGFPLSGEGISLTRMDDLTAALQGLAS